MTRAGIDYRFPTDRQPAYLSLIKGELPIQKFRFVKWYNEKYFVPGTFRPVLHTIAVVMTIGYFIDYHYHLKYLQHSRKLKHLQEKYSDAPAEH
uniref:ATP synthase subunit f, mitochondrial n=1 Tax=Chrysotila carterae TaxID=13221 RepID=A0A7S4ETM4_CHRCT